MNIALAISAQQQVDYNLRVEQHLKLTESPGGPCTRTSALGRPQIAALSSVNLRHRGSRCTAPDGSGDFSCSLVPVQARSRRAGASRPASAPPSTSRQRCRGALVKNSNGRMVTSCAETPGSRGYISIST